MAREVKIFTDNGIPCMQIDAFSIVSIFSVQHMYATNARLVFRFNNVNDSDILPDDTLKISGTTVSGSNEAKAQALRNYLKDFFVEAPGEGGGSEWFGTQQEYDELGYHNPNTKYYIQSESVRLDTPENFTAVADGYDKINLAWSAVDDAENYTIERSSTEDFTIATQIYEGSGTGYSDVGLAANTRYYYRIRAIAHGANPSNYAFINEITAEGPVAEAIVWSQLQSATNTGGGTITGTSTTPMGGTATKKLLKVNGNYVEYTNSSSDGAVLCFEAVNNANYRWSSSGNVILSSVYVYMGSAHALTGQANGSGDAVLGSASVNDVYRLEISGNDVLVKKSADSGGNFTTIHTHAGVLSGVTDIYVVAIIAVTGSKRLNNVKGFGLINM